MARDLLPVGHGILISIHENIWDLEGKRAFAGPEEQGYITGRLVSYREVPAIMKEAALRFGYDPGELGL